MSMQLKIKYFKAEDYNDHYNKIIDRIANANNGIVDFSKNRYAVHYEAEDRAALDAAITEQNMDNFIETHKVVKVMQLDDKSWKIIYKYSDIDKLVDDLTAQRMAFPFERFETYCQMHVHLPTRDIPEAETEKLFKEFCDIIHFDYKTLNKNLDEALLKQKQELTEHVLALQTL